MSGLLIRADASTRIGTGHVMRCLALAAPWVRAKTPVTLAAAELTDNLRKRVLEAGVIIRDLDAPAGSRADAQATASLAADADLLVVDGYQFDAAYSQVFGKADRRVLWIDDDGRAANYSADFVLNQSIGTNAALYPQRGRSTRLFLGPKHALLREDFQPWRQWQRQTPEKATRFLVTLGGSDPDNVTTKVIEGLRQLAGKNRFFEATVIAGAANPHLPLLEAAARSLPWLRVASSVNDMAQRMAEADFAITAAGTTVWEMAFMGLPSLVLTLAENQIANASELPEAGIARSLGGHENVTTRAISDAVADLAADRSARDKMSRAGRALVDGLGSFRVWLAIAGEKVALRDATASDSRMLWDWANEPGIRAASFSSESIPWPAHEKWLGEQLSRPDRILWIAEDAEGSLGQVRFALEEDEALISVSLDPGRRGRSLGSLLIGLGCRKFFETHPTPSVRALIKPDNRVSIRAFEQAGFVKTGSTEVKGMAALAFRLEHRTAQA